MKRLVFTLICLGLTPICFSQKYLIENEKSILHPELNSGIPNDSVCNFINFKEAQSFKSVQGLSDKNYIATAAQLSSIAIEKEDVGRVVLYAKLFNSSDSLLFNPVSKRQGKIIIKSYRDNDIINETTHTSHFGEDIYQQIYFNTYRAGVNKIIIDFESKEDLFIVENLKVIPYNETGINYYKELENSEKEILNLSKNLRNEATKLKDRYVEQINRIQSSHSSLSLLINGKKFEHISMVQANSLNPFKNQKFNTHYNKILEKASHAEKLNLENLTNDLKNNNFSNIALTLDNLFLGGKFASVVNLIDGLFKNNITITDSNSNKIEIITIESILYYKKNWGNNKFKLYPVEDKEVLAKINLLTKENNAFKSYVNDIASFLKEDLQTLDELSKDIQQAKQIRLEFENLTWEFFERFAQNDRSHYIKETGVNFFEIGTQLGKNFQPRKFRNISALRQIRNESILSIKKINELMAKYDAIVSKIKTKYDLIYEIRPKQRKKHFNSLNYLPDNLKSDWKDKQDEIIDEYTKEEGLKRFLEVL